MFLINKNHIVTAGIVLMAAGLSGCSVFKPAKTYEGSGKGLQGWIVTEQDDAEHAAVKVGEKISEAGKDVSETLDDAAGKLAQNTTKVIDKVSDKDGCKPSPDAAVLSGDWAIMEVLGKRAVGETPPCIKFVPSENRMYGNNGCNVMNASYNVDYAARTIRFGNIATTMMLCGQTDITDVEVGQALGMTAKYSVNTDDSDATMRFYDEKGKEVMKLMHRDFHFLDGTWNVIAINGEKVDIDGMKLALDVDEKRMHGNTGCNIINGELETDMETANSISFSKIGMTRMACPDSGWETRMVMALEEAVTAEKISADKIGLIGSHGQQVMLLEKTSPIED